MKLILYSLILLLSSIAFSQTKIVQKDSLIHAGGPDTVFRNMGADSAKVITHTIPDISQPAINSTASQGWQPKDFITLFASILAVVISVIGLVQKWHDKKTDYRKQLTTLMEKITTLNIEAEKYKIKPSESPPNYQSLINDQRRFFVRDAAFVSDKIKTIVRPFEWNIIAWAFVKIDEPEEAERYFLLAIDKAITQADKGLTNRSYAGFCFDEKRFKLSDEYYKRAIVHFTGDNDRMIYYRTTTLERWALVFQNRNEAEYRNKIQLACDEWTKHSNIVRARYEIERIQKSSQQT